MFFKLQDDPIRWKMNCAFRGAEAMRVPRSDMNRLRYMKKCLHSVDGLCLDQNESAWLTTLAIKGGWRAPASTTQKAHDHA